MKLKAQACNGHTMHNTSKSIMIPSTGLKLLAPIYDYGVSKEWVTKMEETVCKCG